MPLVTKHPECLSMCMSARGQCCGRMRRYPWPLLKPLVAHLLGDVVEQYASTAQVEVGPALPLSGGESAEELKTRLLQLLESFEDEAPFTVQRLAEVLLEPEKQYARLDKLVNAISYTRTHAFRHPTASFKRACQMPSQIDR